MHPQANKDGSISIFSYNVILLWYIGIFIASFVLKYINWDGNILLYGMAIHLFFMVMFFSYYKVTFKFDDFFQAKNTLMVNINIASLSVGLSIFAFSAILGNRYYDKNITFFIIGLIIFLISLWMIFSSPKRYVRKTIDDYDDIIVQERMYDNIKIQLKDAFQYRIIKNEKGDKELYPLDINNEVVDIFQNIKPEIHQEIKDLINYIVKGSGKSEFAEYKVTLLDYNSEDKIDEYLKELTTPIKSINEDFKFYRYIYQHCINELKKVKKDQFYDFKENIIKYKGVVEFAIMELYAEHANRYQNIPMGNILAYAAESKQSMHFAGALDSMLNTSVHRKGIGIYTAYYLSKEHIENTKKEN